MNGAPAETIWFDDSFIYRGLDTSSGDPAYAQYTDTKYGAVWAKRFMAKGESFLRSPALRHFHPDGALVKVDSPVSSYLTVVDIHTNYVFPTGKTVANVVELTWRYSLNAPVTERYFYGMGLGLVGFLGPVYKSAYAGAAGALEVPRRAIWKVVEPVPPYKRAPLYAAGLYPLEATIRFDALHFRSAPTSSSAALRTFQQGEAVTYWQYPIIHAGGYDWVRVMTKTDGLKGWCPLVVDNELTFTPAGDDTTNSEHVGTVHFSMLSFRRSPSKYGAIIRTFKQGERVSYILPPVANDGVHQWVRVKAFDTEGYAALTDGGVNSFDPIQPFTFRAPFHLWKIVSHFNAPRAYNYPGKNRLHEGIDFEPNDSCGCDPVVHAGVAGKVTVGWDADGYGNYVKLVPSGDTQHVLFYGHFDQVYVKDGQVVKEGEILGLMGNTGNSTEAHVHVTLQDFANGLSGYVVDKVVDPEPLVRSW